MNSELLAAVETAISKVLTGGQSATWDGNSVTLTDLPKLEEARARLQRAVAAEKRHARGDYSPARWQRARFY